MTKVAASKKDVAKLVYKCNKLITNMTLIFL